MAQQPYFVYATLTALNEVSDHVAIRGRHEIIIKGNSFVGEVTLQWKTQESTTWYDVKSWTDDFIDSEEIGSAIQMRFKVTAYTSGSVTVHIRKNTAD